MIFAVSAIAAVVLSLRDAAPRSAGQGEYNSLILFSVLGMAILVSAQNLVTLFVGFELLSIPLYVLCASEFRREGSLESGLKYLVIGSVGSATLVYGLALVYGATGSTQFAGIDSAILTGGIGHGLLGDPLLLTGLAPGHRGVRLQGLGGPVPSVDARRLRGRADARHGVHGRPPPRPRRSACCCASSTSPPSTSRTPGPPPWPRSPPSPSSSATSARSASPRSSACSATRAWPRPATCSSGVIVATQLGVNATVLYLGLYMFMNLAAFAVIVAVQRERADGDELSGLAGLGRRNPWLAWPMTIAMLALAGIPGTVGFIGKFQLIHALVDGGYTWLAVVLVIGSMISLGYYLRVIASAVDARRGPRPRTGHPRPRWPVAAGWRRSPAARPRPTTGEGAFATAPRASGMAGRASRAGGHRGRGAVRRRHRGLRDLPLSPVQPSPPMPGGRWG